MSYYPNNPNGQAAMANSQPVVLASDQSSIPTAATLNAETTKAIGVVRASDGAGNLLTSNSTTTSSKFGLDSNILSILGTAPTTAGKLDIKGADGDVFVRNATAANFLANVTLQTQTDTTMVGGVNIKEINAVTPLMGNGTTGTGSLRVTIASDNTSNTNAWLVAGNKTNNNAAPAATQLGVMPGVANAAAQTWTEGDQVLESMDLSGNQRVSLGTALSQAIDSILTYDRGTSYSDISASALILTGAGKLAGIFVASASSTPTIKVWDNTSAASTVLINTFTPVAGTMYTFPKARVGTGIYVTIGGTVDCTVFWDPTTT